MVINHLLTGMILQVVTLHTEVSLDFLLFFFFGEILHRKKILRMQGRIRKREKWLVQKKRLRTKKCYRNNLFAKIPNP